MATRISATGIVSVPMKAATTIAINGLVCVDATGYAVPGADTAGLKFIGIAAQGKANAGANGAVNIKVYTRGLFKLTTAGMAVTDHGVTVYATGAALANKTATNGVEVGKVARFMSATSCWIDINQATADVGTSSIADLAITEGKIGPLAVTEGKIGALAVTAGKIGASAVTLAKLHSGVRPGLICMAAGIATMTRDENVAGLASACTLANELNADLALHGLDDGEHTAAVDSVNFPDVTYAFAVANNLKVVMNAHAADAAEHVTAIDNVNFPVATADATDLTTLIALTTSLLTAYDAHDADAELAAAWAYHGAQEAADASLTSAVAPATFGECMTRLADLVAKYNAHDADVGCHVTGSTHQENTIGGFSFQANNLVTLLSVATAILAQYDAHDTDAEGAVPTYHAAQEAGDHSLVSAVAPATLEEAVTRLNDLKTKFNAHDADGTAHGTDTQHQIAAAAAAYGATNRLINAGVLIGDIVTFSILNDGTGNVTGVSGAVTVDGYIDLTFSADPQNDAIVSYQAHRLVV